MSEQHPFGVTIGPGKLPSSVANSDREERGGSRGIDGSRRKQGRYRPLGVAARQRW